MPLNKDQLERHLGKEKEVVSEREEKMLEADKLLRPAKEVVVVAARIAWPEYQKYHAYYLCQPNRTFQQVEYFGLLLRGPDPGDRTQNH